MKAVLSGLSVPELSAEIDRLRQRKLDLESVIAAKQQSSSHLYTPEEIHGVFLCLLHDFEPRNTVRALVQKIYANADGSCTVHIGVHIPGAGGSSPQGFSESPYFDKRQENKQFGRKCKWTANDKNACFSDSLFPLENWIFGKSQKDNISTRKVLLKSQHTKKSTLEVSWKKSGLSKIK